ncbi:hypothetical protein FDECE_3648 [Fusarium decemcellulare]|nr:hypothetical protein FDECE_3648 [Fusarium decemcellulare]
MRFASVIDFAAATISQCSAAVDPPHYISHRAEAPSVRSSLYVGGAYVADGTGGHVFRDQMYVEKLVPAAGVRQPDPIVLIHGQGQTGSNFLNKPDGGRGWASLFIDHGYEVYIVDQTLRGRSPWMLSDGTTRPSALSVEAVERMFTAVAKFKLWPQAVNHTQWPGSGLRGDPIFDAFYSSNVQFIDNSTYQQDTVQAAGAALLDRIGRPTILLGHSQGGFMPTLIADARPELTKSIILLEPGGPPFKGAIYNPNVTRPWGLVDIPITYDPAVTDPAVDLVQQVHVKRDERSIECILQAENPKPRQLVNLEDKPILIVTGEASYHAPYDHCTAEFFRQAGCDKTKHIELGKVGVHGNGHMLFMEKNSDEIFAIVEGWIQSN